MTATPITPDFIKNFLFQTEKKWAKNEIKGGIYGFQFQAGTIWNPGLSQKDIDAYQSELGIQFPADFLIFLQHANGTDLQTVNVYGNDGKPHAFAPGVYSYPRDLGVIKSRIEWLKEEWGDALDSLGLEQDVLGKDPKFIPFYGHRYILCGGNPDSSIVCSIVESDVIVYGASLKDYLVAEFL